MRTFINRVVSAVDNYLWHARTAPWESYLAGSRDAQDLERRLNQLERGETHHFGLD